MLVLFSSHAYASRVNLYEEANGPLGPTISFNEDGVGVKVDAYYYDLITKEVVAAVVVGIDGEQNIKHPAGIGVGKSMTSVNPPGLDNVGGAEVNGIFHDYLEFLVFSFDSNVTINAVETGGLGPHGTAANYWGGVSILADNFDVDALGDKYTADETAPIFTPSAGLGDVSWFAIGAKPEDAFNVFSIQTIQFTKTQSVSAVPVPAAFWLFASALVGLRFKKNK